MKVTTIAADVETIVSAIDTALGGEFASADPNEVPVPGAWLQVTGWSHDVLDGYTLLGAIWLVVDDSDHLTAIQALADLENKLRQAWPAYGVVDAGTLSLPQQPSALPALRYPIAIPSQYEEESP